MRWAGAILAAMFSPLGCTSLRDSGSDEIISAGGEGSLQSRIHLNKGVHLVEKGKLPHAATSFQRAIDIDPSNGSAHNNLGLVLYEQRHLAKAAAEFEAAAQLMPQNATPLYNLGMTLEAAGKGFEAVDYYHQAYQLDPRNPIYLGNLVKTRIRLGDNDESVIGQLQELLFIETRPEWINWINDQLALELNPYLDRGPAPANLDPKDGDEDSTKKKKDKPVEVDEPMEWQDLPAPEVENVFPSDLGGTIMLDPSSPMVEVELEEFNSIDPTIQ